MKDPDHIEGPFSIYFGNTPLTTTVVSDSVLTAIVPAQYILNPQTVQITVGSADFVSNIVTFQVMTATTPSLVPSADFLGPNATRQFAAQGVDTSSGLTWSVQEGTAGGIVTSNGLYTAPTQPGVFHIVADSVSSPTQSAAATVTVLNSGFTPTGSMNAPRTGHTSVLLANGKVLVMGGGDTRMELFDPATNVFSFATGTVQVSSVVKAVVLLDGRVLFLGLSTGDSSPRINMIYNPPTGDFIQVGNMLQARAEYTATLLINGKVLVTGGALGGGAGEAFNSAELFDPSTGTFSVTGSMLSARADHTATLLSSGLVLVAGGWNGHRADAPDDPPWDPLVTELFDPTTGSFRPTGSMSTTRLRHTAVRLADSSVLVMGGIPAMQNLHSQPPYPSYGEVYDPADGIFLRTDNIVFRYDSYTATLLEDGHVLIAGGQLSNSPISSAYLIDTAKGTVEPTGSLATPRKGHTATLLNDGRVLVIGGTDASGIVLAGAELYR